MSNHTEPSVTEKCINMIKNSTKNFVKSKVLKKSSMWNPTKVFDTSSGATQQLSWFYELHMLKDLQLNEKVKNYTRNQKKEPIFFILQFPLKNAKFFHPSSLLKKI